MIIGSSNITRYALLKNIEWDVVVSESKPEVKFDKAKGKDVVTYLYDIVTENELPDYLQYDFGLTK